MRAPLTTSLQTLDNEQVQGYLITSGKCEEQWIGVQLKCVTENK